MTAGASSPGVPMADGVALGEVAAPPAVRPRRNKSKGIGTEAETGVARYLAANGWPSAERRTQKGTYDQGDITGTPGICWEVKGGEAARKAGDAQIAAWLIETETERLNARADLGVLVVARPGYGPKRAGCWWAVMRLDTLAELTRTAAVRDLYDGQIDAAPYVVATPAAVRLLLADAVLLVRAAGYGDPLGEVE